MKVLTVVGARPQFIKAAPLSRALRARHKEILVHTGQHYDEGMSQVFFDALAIPEPDHHLGAGSASHGVQTARILEGLERVVMDESPDAVLVFGDTNSTLAGALVAAKLHVPLGHVEAGLRSFDRTMPEEVNRVVADHLAQGLYCSSDAGRRQLAKEGILKGVHVVGDLMVDQFLEARQRAVAPGRSGYWLLTLHRPSNTDDPQRLRAIIDAIGQAGVDVLFPAHPRTVAALESAGIRLPPRIERVAPLGYLEMQGALLAADGVLTDSGGLQKEAMLAARPCLTLRDSTEWTETVEAGWNRLVGADPDAIQEGIRSFRPRGDPPMPWGDGQAAARIVDAVEGLCAS